jgi:hypothetical protein
MAWTNSKVFVRWPQDLMGNTTAGDMDADTPKVALYNTTTAPDQTVTAANTAYAVGQWVTGNEITDASGWPAGGRPLVTPTWVGQPATTITYDAADTASANSNTTLAAVFGCLVYDDTLSAVVVDQGMSYHYFGGTQSVTAGTFSVIWNASGIQTYSL